MNPIVDRVRKLLKLSQSDNVNEAAQAAARAQELMLQHKIEAADLELSGGEKRSYEPVEDTTLEGYKTSGRTRVQRWRIQLAGNLARSFGCKVYYTPGTTHIGIVGRQSDIQTVKYLLDYLGLEITRLCEEGWRKIKAEADFDSELPRPSVWKASFKDGAVSAIAQKLDEKKRAEVEIMTAAVASPNASQALVLVRQDEEAHKKEVNSVWTERFGKRGGSSASWSYRRHSQDGYSAGKTAGAGMNVSGGGKGLPGSKTRIGG